MTRMFGAQRVPENPTLLKKAVLGLCKPLSGDDVRLFRLPASRGRDWLAYVPQRPV